MNKTLVLIIMLFYIAADVVGHDIYRPILTECRSWLVVTSSHASDFFNFESYETVKTVFGDTVIDGHSCKIIDNVRKDTGEKFKEILLEEDRTIYWYDEDSNVFVPWMDFNLHTGDDIHEGWGEFYEGHSYVVSEDIVDVNGVVYRRLGTGSLGDEPHIYWVEGIGASEWGLVDYPFASTMGIYTYMKECCENGECIFTKDDFYKEAAGGVSIPSDTGVDDDTIYDLQGRRLQHTVPGINIVNGKKILTR